MKKRAVGYIRVSSIEQTKGTSLDSQRQAIKKYAKEKDWTLGEIYADGGKSGADMEKREGLLRLLRDAAHGKFDIMICYDLDRFGRDVRDIANNRHLLEQSGVEEHFITSPTDDNFIKNIKAAVAQEVREKIKNETTKGRFAALKNGIPQGRRPFNRKYDRETNEWSFKDEFINKRIRWAGKQYLKGKHMEAIVLQLKSEGIKICTSTLYRIFQRGCGDRYSITLKGVVDGKEVVETKWFKIPRIMPQSMIEDIEKRMEKRRYNRDKLRKYVLNNFIFCARCGRSLTGQTQQGRTFYTHPQRKDQGCAPGYKIVPGEGIQKAVFNALYRYIFDVKSFQEAVAQQAPDDTLIKSLKANIRFNVKELKKVEEELDDLVEIALKKTLKPKTLQKKEAMLLKREKQAKEELEADRKKLESLPRLKDFEKQAEAIRKKLLKQFQSVEHLKKMTFKQKRRLLHSLFDGKDQKGKHYGIYVRMKKKINMHKKHFRFEIYAPTIPNEYGRGHGGFYSADPDGLDFHERIYKVQSEQIERLNKERKRKYKTNPTSFG